MIYMLLFNIITTKSERLSAKQNKPLLFLGEELKDCDTYVLADAALYWCLLC